MKAVVLVGGEGTRLRPLTNDLPKALVPVGNEPFISRFISYLHSHGVTQVILAVGSNYTQLEGFLGNGRKYGVDIVYSPESKPLGTAGAIKNAEKYVDGRFIACNGDMLTGIDLTDMVAFHSERRAVVTIALTPVDNPSAYGVVETDSEYRILTFKEKPPPSGVVTNMINAGIYVMEPSLLADIPPDSFAMVERDVFPRLVANGARVFGYPSRACWIDIGTPEKYLAANHMLVNGETPFRLCYDRKWGEVMIQGTATVNPDARLEGRILLGDGCVISKGARIVGPAVLGRGCWVGDDALIEGAVLWDRVRVGSKASLERCIVGSGSTIGDRCQVLDYCVVGSGVHLEGGARLEPGKRFPSC